MQFNTGFRGDCPPKTTIGERIRYLRWEHNHSRRVLSSALYISEAALSMYEFGKRAVPLDVICRLKCLYSVSYDWLLDGPQCTDFTSTTPMRTHLLPLIATTGWTKSRRQG